MKKFWLIFAIVTTLILCIIVYVKNTTLLQNEKWYPNDKNLQKFSLGNSSDTTDWLTYENKFFKYRIKYPPIYKIESCDKDTPIQEDECVYFIPQTTNDNSQIIAISRYRDRHLFEKPSDFVNKLVESFKKPVQNSVSYSNIFVNQYMLGNTELIVLRHTFKDYIWDLSILFGIPQIFHITFPSFPDESHKNFRPEEYSNYNDYKNMVSTFEYIE